MGTIVSRQLKKNQGTSHMATVRVPGHKMKSRTFTTREDAQKFIDETEPPLRAALAATRAAALAKRMASPSLATYHDDTLEEAMDGLSKSPRCSERDKKTVKGLRGRVGDTKIGEIDEAWVEDYIDSNRSGAGGARVLAYATIEGHMQVFRRALKWRAKKLKVQPVALPFSVLQNFPKDWQNKRTRRLAPEEEAQLRALFCKMDDPAREWWTLLLDVALETGARLQEMVKSEAREFDAPSRVWNIPAGHTKKRTARFVVLTMRGQAAVMRLLELASPDSPRLFHAIRDSKTASRKFAGFVKKLGIVGLRMHDLRHEAISRMVSNHRDVQVFEIMQMVGHKKTEMLHLYSHGRADDIAKRMR